MSVRRSRVLMLSLAVLLAVAGLVFAPAQPASATVSYSFSGTIPAGGSVDNFVFLPAGDTFSAALTCPGSQIDPVVSVYDPSGSLIAVNDDGGTDDCLGFRSSLAIFTTTVEGTYRISSRAFGVSQTGPYALTVTGGFAGRGIPDGFVLRTITCSVAVFDAPGGEPVSDNRVLGGQTWYVNPKQTKAAGGESWTEIFVSGTINGWIPSKCVSN